MIHGFRLIEHTCSWNWTSLMHHIYLILYKKNTLRVTSIINIQMYKQTGSTCITWSWWQHIELLVRKKDRLNPSQARWNNFYMFNNINYMYINIEMKQFWTIVYSWIDSSIVSTYRKKYFIKFKNLNLDAIFLIGWHFNRVLWSMKHISKVLALFLFLNISALQTIQI